MSMWDQILIRLDALLKVLKEIKCELKDIKELLREENNKSWLQKLF